MKIHTRRIVVGGVTYTIQPSFIMPYMTGMVDDVEKPLFLRKFGVPFWALAYCYCRNPMYWWRQEASLGRFSIVGTTIEDSNLLPRHIASDEKQTWLGGEKIYCATTVADGCILGACLTGSAGQEDLENAYGVFKQEAQTLNPNYCPETENTDGWLATRNALHAIFPQMVLLMCFLHIFISIRDRSSKKFKEAFKIVSDKLWNCYHAQTKASFSQRMRRLCEWAKKAQIPTFMVDKLEKLRNNLPSFAQTYDFEGALRTNNMLVGVRFAAANAELSLRLPAPCRRSASLRANKTLEPNGTACTRATLARNLVPSAQLRNRLMQRMDRHLFAAQYFHGNLSSANRSMRGWVLIQNFAPFNPRTIEVHHGVRSPAEKLNGFSYRSNWLQNLLVSASLGGYRGTPPNPL